MEIRGKSCEVLTEHRIQDNCIIVLQAVEGSWLLCLPARAIPIGVDANTPGKALLTQVLPTTVKGDQHSRGLPTGKQFVGFLFV